MTSVFGEKLRALRTESKKTLKDLAEALNVSVVYISDIERGRRNPPSNEKIHHLASILQVCSNELVDAAALDRDRVELELCKHEDSISDKTALALARRWSSFTEEELNNIMQIINER